MTNMLYYDENLKSFTQKVDKQYKQFYKNKYCQLFVNITICQLFVNILFNHHESSNYIHN